jgi:hypothetical protein
MRYIKVEFTRGLEMLGYQEVDDYGQVSAFLDEVGQEFIVPEGVEYHVVEEEPKIPFEKPTYLFREPVAMPALTVSKEELMVELTASLVANNIPQEFIDQIVSDMTRNIQ